MSTVAGPLGPLFSLRGTDQRRTDSDRNGRDQTGQDTATLRVTSGGRTASNPNANLLLRRVTWTESGDQQAAAALREHTAAAMFPASALLAAANARRAAAIDRLRRRGRHCTELRVRPVWRVAIGLGEDNPTEVGLRLHGTYGVPVLPGSALKGVTRALARTDGKDYPDYGQDVFGHEPPGSDGDRRAPAADSGAADTAEDTAKAGGVMFLDALPDPPARRSSPVVSDLVNPHVGKYYGDRGATAPAEYHQPVPVPFLAVTSAVSFRVYVISGRHATDVEPDLAAGWLTTALDDLGIGGKTTAGYGYLEVEPAPDPAAPAPGTGGGSR